MKSAITARQASVVPPYLPVVLLILLLSVSSPVARRCIPGASAQAGEAAKAEKAGSHAGGQKEKGGTSKRPKAPPRIPVPLTGGRLIFMAAPGGAGKVIATNAPASIVFESSEKRKFEGLDTLKAQKYLNSSMMVKLADKKGDHVAVVEAFMVADDTDGLIAKINASQPAFFESITNYLSSLTIEDFDKPGAANLLRAHLLDLCNRELRAKMVSEIIITRRIYR